MPLFCFSYGPVKEDPAKECAQAAKTVFVAQIVVDLCRKQKRGSVGAIRELRRAFYQQPAAEGMEHTAKFFNVRLFACQRTTNGGKKNEIVTQGEPRTGTGAMPHRFAKSAIVGAVTFPFAKAQSGSVNFDITEHLFLPLLPYYLYHTAFYEKKQAKNGKEKKSYNFFIIYRKTPPKVPKKPTNPATFLQKDRHSSGKIGRSNGKSGEKTAKVPQKARFCRRKNGFFSKKCESWYCKASIIMLK